MLEVLLHYDTYQLPTGATRFDCPDCNWYTVRSLGDDFLGIALRSHYRTCIEGRR